MSKITIKFKKLSKDAVIPKAAHPGDIGLDITATSCEYDANTDTYIYHTGLALESDQNIGDLLFVRSSNNKTDAYLANHVGLVDSASYRGEVQLRFKNRSSIHVEVMHRVIPRLFVAYSLFEHIGWALVGKGRDYTSALYLNVLEDVMADVEEEARNLEFAPYKVGDRIGQMVFVEFPEVEAVEVDSLSDTVRGEGGFGSSGD